MVVFEPWLASWAAVKTTFASTRDLANIMELVVVAAGLRVDDAWGCGAPYDSGTKAGAGLVVFEVWLAS